VRDKRWLSELGYHHRPRRSGAMLTALFDLIGAFTLAAIFGVLLWLLK
jgi:hypothetical protein